MGCKNYYVCCNSYEYYGTEAFYSEYVNNELMSRLDMDKLSPRELLIESVKDCIEDVYKSDFREEFLPLDELQDFINTLSDNLTGEELYKNFCDNCEFIDEITTNFYTTYKRDSLQKTLFPSYSRISVSHDSCTLRPFNKNINNLLKNNKDFVEFVKKNLFEKDVNLYKQVFGTKDCDVVIDSYNKELEQLTLDMDYLQYKIEENKKQTEVVKKKIKELGGVIS